MKFGGFMYSKIEYVPNKSLSEYFTAYSDEYMSYEGFLNDYLVNNIKDEVARFFSQESISSFNEKKFVEILSEIGPKQTPPLFIAGNEYKKIRNQLTNNLTEDVLKTLKQALAEHLILANLNQINTDLGRISFFGDLENKMLFDSICQSREFTNYSYTQGMLDAPFPTFLLDQHNLFLKKEHTAKATQDEFFSDLVASKRVERFAYKDDTGNYSAFSIAFNLRNPKNWMIEIEKNTTKPLEKKSILFVNGDLQQRIKKESAQTINAVDLDSELETTLQNKKINAFCKGLIQEDGCVSLEVYSTFVRKSTLSGFLNGIEKINVLKEFSQKKQDVLNTLHEMSSEDFVKNVHTLYLEAKEKLTDASDSATLNEEYIKFQKGFLRNKGSFLQGELENFYEKLPKTPSADPQNLADFERTIKQQKQLSLLEMCFNQKQEELNKQQPKQSSFWQRNETTFSSSMVFYALSLVAGALFMPLAAVGILLTSIAVLAIVVVTERSYTQEWAEYDAELTKLNTYYDTQRSQLTQSESSRSLSKLGKPVLEERAEINDEPGNIMVQEEGSTPDPEPPSSPTPK